MNIDFELTSVIERTKYLLSNCQKNTQFLFYAALELRYAIEILLDDWLNFVIQGSFSLSKYLKELFGDEIPKGSLNILENKKVIDEQKKVSKIYLAKKYQNKILEFVPKFEKRIEFMTLLEPSFKEMKIPKLNYINEVYGKIGAYLHYYKQEINIDEIYSNLIDILKYVESLNEPKRCFIELNEDGERLFDKFERNQLSAEELKDIKLNGIKYHNGGLYQL